MPQQSRVIVVHDILEFDADRLVGVFTSLDKAAKATRVSSWVKINNILWQSPDYRYEAQSISVDTVIPVS